MCLPVERIRIGGNRAEEPADPALILPCPTGNCGVPWHDRGVPWIELIVIAAVLVGVALMAGGRGDGLAEAPPDRPDQLVETQSGPLTAEQVKAARFGVGFRGYRMDEVDALLDRLAAQLPSADTTDSDDATDADNATDADGTAAAADVTDAVAPPPASIDAEAVVDAQPDAQPDAQGAASSQPNLGPQS